MTEIIFEVTEDEVDGRHSARALKPYPDYRDSGVQVAGEGAGALGGATAAHQSFWDNGPRS